MMQNVHKAERTVRVVLGIVLGILACIVSGWPGWVRIGSGIVAAAFIVTALVGY